MLASIVLSEPVTPTPVHTFAKVFIQFKIVFSEDMISLIGESWMKGMVPTITYNVNEPHRWIQLF